MPDGDGAPARILFVDHTSRPGGAELSLLRYLQQADDGGRAELVTFEDGFLAKQAEDAGRRVHRVGRGSGITRRLSILAGLRRVLGRDDALVIANSLTAAMYLSLLPKRRRTYAYYLREDLSPEWLRGPRRFLAVRLSLPRFDAFIANSRWTASTVPARLAGRPTFVAYPVSGVTTAAEHDEAAPAGPLRVLSLSRLSEWKGVHVLLQAVQELHRRGLAGRVTVTIAGDDVFGATPYLSSLRELASGIEDDVRFVGHLTDTSAALGSHDVLVSCSLLAEPFGQVIVQGMAHGLVTIGTDMGGPAEVITDGVDGLLLPPGDPDRLADALEGILGDPQRARRLSRSGLATARRFTDRSTVSRLAAVLSTLESPRAGHAPQAGVLPLGS